MGWSAARSSGRTPAQRTLLTLLELAFGSPGPAQASVATALALSGREDLPPTGPELVAFVRAHMTAPLNEQLGPRFAMALLNDLVTQLEAIEGAHAGAQSSAPPSSMPRPVAGAAPRAPSSLRVRKAIGVGLVDPDRVGRTALARALVRESWDVTVLDSPGDASAAVDAGSALDVLLVDVQHSALEAIVQAGCAANPGIAVVARGADPDGTWRLLRALGVVRMEIRSRDAPPDELVHAVRTIVDAQEG